MNQYLIYIGIGFAILLVCLIIPGVKIIAEAIFKGLVEMTTELFKHKSSFVIWLIKTLVSDHLRVLQHATQSRDTIDPTQSIRRKALGYDDNHDDAMD
ncbi:hypothetical protein ACOTHJ_15320 [Achromobacter xylosoxidans]